MEEKMTPESSSGHGTFALFIGCMDGRDDKPGTDWIRENFPNIEFVDKITAPGTNGLLAGNVQKLPEVGGVQLDASKELEGLRGRAAISVVAHGAQLIVISGHDQCAGNPDKSRDSHIQDIQMAIETVKGWGDEYARLPIYGLYSSKNQEGEWISEEVASWIPQQVAGELKVQVAAY